MDNYAKNYIDTFYTGIKKTKYKISGEKSESSSFFHELNEKTKEVKENGGRLFFFGNGASASFSNHMALDWSKNGGILALCLSDSAMLTALANDYDFEGCFLEFLKINSPTSNDLVVTTSSSGNSKNIVKILEYCKENTICSFGLSGLNEGNKTEILSDFSLFVPMKTYGMVECIHQLFHHIFLDKFMGIEEWNKTESQNMDARNFKL
ncbi:SIS domain-containing protein [Flavobacteriaceae bacterium]|nr:SIS domain-containing protein [Flavobacteriaceae bacterium]|tara:strand:- start:85 stop:708 length:624 start_codon:yes stop_codon:yes gene_type:complete